MVLVNTLTVEAINTALIALQRGQSIVVGGEKPGTTVNNITISNGGGSGGGSGLDFTPQITALDKRVGLLEKAEELLRQENERQNERLDALEGLGITDFYFDDTSRELTIELANGEVFDTEVTSESFSMDVVNGELIIRIGEQVHTVTLPMGSQADWTQTDPDDPSFIKHKIPIWITQGSADDNMSPIDSVTDGSMRPVTSNAVAQKGYLTSADITNQVTVDNMQSVSSNAVYNAINNITQLTMGDLPRNANNAGVVGKISVYYGYADPSNLTNYPSFSWSSAGNYPFWFLIDFCGLPRETQLLYVTYYTGTTWQVARQFKRGRVDVTWFGWVEIT